MVWGIADLHFHMANHLGFGGRFLSGLPDHPEGLHAALRHCEHEHGVGGTGLGASLPVVSFIESTGYGAGVGHLTGGHPEFDGWPRFTTVMHQQGHVEWIRRAFDGGLRLIVALAGNNEMLAHLLGPGRPSDDHTVVDDEIRFITEMVGRHDFMQIALTPDEARATIESGRLAVVLGVEVDTLGGFDREHNCSNEDVAQYLQHLVDIGVRYVFPVHLANNALGGCALYHGYAFYLLQLYLRGEPFTIDDGGSEGIEFKFVAPAEAEVAVRALGLSGTGVVPPHTAGGHVNGLGLTERGRVALETMMRLGLIIDVDHLSAKALNDVLDRAETNNYPVVSGHTGFRDLAWSSARGETAAMEKSPSETLKTARSLERIRRLGGMIAPQLAQGDIRRARDADPNIPERSIAPCAGSSSSFAEAYLYAVAKMGGQGVGIGSDCNGLAQFPGPRFGPNAAYHLHSGQVQDPVRRGQRQAQVDAQVNGVRYSSPVRDWRAYRWREGVTADEMTEEERDMWQAVAVVRSGCDVWADRQPDGTQGIDGVSERVRNLAKGLSARDDAQLLRPGIFTGDAPWEQRTGFLIATAGSPGNSERDPTRVHELFGRLHHVWAEAQRMDGPNPPLIRSVAGRRDFDVNIDGFAHYGMLPDFLADLRNVGLTESDLAPLFNSAEAFLQTWERCARRPPPAALDVFWIGPDGAVGTTWANPQVDNANWHPPFPISPPGAARPDSPLAAVTR